MQVTMSRSLRGSVRPFQSQPCKMARPSVFRLSLCSARASRGQLQTQQQQEQHREQQLVTGLDAVSLSIAGVLLQPLTAWADEAAISSTEAQTSAAEAVQNTVDAPAWLGYVLLLSPIIFYAIFNVWRNQVNPRAKFTDFLFIVAGVAVVANLVSILAFRVRLF